MSKKPQAVIQPSFGLATGIPIERPNRNVSTAAVLPPPSAVGGGDRNTQTFTYFTKAGPQASATPILYNADREWARVTMVLETAGPVAVGTRANLFPVLSGKGDLLTTNVPFVLTIAKGDGRLYIASTSVNRVKVVIEPLPWLEQIEQGVENISNLLAQLAARK